MDLFVWFESFQLLVSAVIQGLNYFLNDLSVPRQEKLSINTQPSVELSFLLSTWTWSVLLCRDEVVAGGGQSVAGGGPDPTRRPGQEQTSQPGR